MQDIEPTNLCETCRKMPECFQKGIFKREACDEYEPLSLGELVERDKFVRAVMVGACPRCGSDNTSDCDNPLELVNDPTIAYCLDCGTYWCLECGHVFDLLEKGMQCPHWKICAECSDEHGYLGEGEFIERICPTCEHYDNGCQLEDRSKCDKEWQYLCPYVSDVSQCPKIQEFLQGQS
ncbi:hypothetical protein ES703_44051 [subsurface metagenome]